jgi:hypothetical protein
MVCGTGILELGIGDESDTDYDIFLILGGGRKGIERNGRVRNGPAFFMHFKSKSTIVHTQP